MESVFGVRQSREILNWILKDPENNNNYLSLVALMDDRIICHIGYIQSYYCMGGKRVVGAHPILWAVDPGFRGKIARELYKMVLDSVDISLIYEGTPSAQRVYPKLGYRRFTEVGLYRRHIDLPIFRPGTMRNPMDLARLAKAGLLWGMGTVNRSLLRRKQNRAITFKPFLDGDEIKYPDRTGVV